jgi:hypothetical protein
MSLPSQIAASVRLICLPWLSIFSPIRLAMIAAVPFCPLQFGCSTPTPGAGFSSAWNSQRIALRRSASSPGYFGGSSKTGSFS